jgi:hypothetical protein
MSSYLLEEPCVGETSMSQSPLGVDRVGRLDDVRLGDEAGPSVEVISAMSASDCRSSRQSKVISARYAPAIWPGSKCASTRLDPSSTRGLSLSVFLLGEDVVHRPNRDADQS